MMKDDVLKGNIPIRVEHENKFYSDIGVWKDADIVGDKLFVKGEIDLELSMARDLEVLLRKGKKVCMSVGGKVMDVVTEFVKEANKYVTTYKDIKLFEISIVKNPANQETTLAIAKSFNLETKEETEVAKSLSEAAAELIKVPTMKEAIVAKSVNEVFKVVSENIKKDWDDTCVAPDESQSYQLSSSDLKYIAMFIQASEAFKGTEYSWEERMEIEDQIYKAQEIGLPDECYVIELLPGHWFPHHNVDFTLNEEWLKYCIWNLVSGNYSWLSPKEYRLAISHLWRHYIMLNAPTVQGEAKKSAFEKEMTETEVTAIFKACYEYKTLKKGARPQVDGNDLSDKEISKMANAFKAITERVRYSQTTASIAKNFYSLPIDTMTIEKAKTEEAKVAEQVATVETQAVETTSEEVAPAADAAPVEVAPVVHGVAVTEKNTDGAEDVTPAVTEEAGTDASLNNTGSEEAPATEVAPVETAPVAEEAPAAEVASEVTKTEEVPAEVATEAPVAEGEPAPAQNEGDVLAKAKALVDSAIAEAIAPLATAIEAMKTFIESAESVTKSREETFTKNFEKTQEETVRVIKSLADKLSTVTSQVSAMNSSIAFRKSSAVAIEKTSTGSGSEDLSSEDGFKKAILSEMDSNGGDYTKARNAVIAKLNAPQA